MKRKETGKDQLNSERDRVNDRIDNLEYLGNSKSAEWRRKRRNRSY